MTSGSFNSFLVGCMRVIRATVDASDGHTPDGIKTIVDGLVISESSLLETDGNSGSGGAAHKICV